MPRAKTFELKIFGVHMPQQPFLVHGLQMFVKIFLPFSKPVEPCSCKHDSPTHIKYEHGVRRKIVFLFQQFAFAALDNYKVEVGTDAVGI